MDVLKSIIQSKKQERESSSSSLLPPSISLPVLLESPNKIDSEIPLSKDQIIFRLRKLKQPAIFFGESLKDQYLRLETAEMQLVENKASLHTEVLEIDKLEELIPGDPKLYWQSELMDQGKECQRFEDEGKIWKKEKWTHPFFIEAEGLEYPQKALVVAMWWREVLNEWKVKNNENLGKQYLLTLKLFKKLLAELKEQTVIEEILGLMFVLVRFCQIKSYTKAIDVYLKISSNNTFYKKVTKKNSEQGFRQISHAFKRLLTLCEKLFPI